MPIKSILVPLNGVDSDRSTLDLALAAGRASGAHIEGLFVKRDPTEALAYAGLDADSAGLQHLADKIAREAAQASAEPQRRWRAWRTDNDLAEVERPGKAERVTVAFRERLGPARDRLVEAGRAVDLIVLAGPSDDTFRLPELVVEAALFETGRPVLAAPPAPTKLSFSTAVVAWNGSLEANRAVAAAMPLLAGCRQLFVFCRAERHRAPADPAPLLDYFAWHGLKADRLGVYQQHGSVGEDLLAAAGRVGAGLLVMGAYTHTRLREMILGGVTSHVLHHATMPALLAH